MKDIFRLLKRVNKLKENRRRGWMLHDIANAETTAEHTFHLALLVWLAGEKKNDIDTERAMKMALVHDMCEAYAPDFTSYDAAGLDENKELTKKDLKNIRPKKGRPTTAQREKLGKLKKELEQEAMEKITKGLGKNLKEEILDLWNDYEEGISTESRFVKQADRMINLLQGLDYYKRYGKIEYELWVRRAKEVIDDEHLVALLKEIEKDI